MRISHSILFFLILLLVPVSAAEAKIIHHKAVPAEETPLQLIPSLPPLYTTYDVYVGGLHLVAAQVWFEEEGNKYHAIVKAETHGLWAHLFPWNTVLDAHGRIVGDVFEPQEFFTRDEWGHKPKVTALHFNGKGDVVPEFDPPNTDQNREVVTIEQRFNSLDPITALLQMLAHVDIEKNCVITVPVFDGKRRFDITGRDDGSDDIDSEGYGVYSGKARLCAADFRMISGEWKDREHAHFWQKTQTESGRDPFHIWVARVGPDLPDMPVRLETGSIAGLVVVHLSSWRFISADDIKAQMPQGLK